MKKKQLNRRQLWRIQKMQDEYAARADRKQAQANQEIQTSELGQEQKGVVISHFGQQLDIEALEGEKRGQIFRCHQRANLEPLVTGDNVIWQQGDPVGVVVASLPRQTVLKRPSSFGDLRPVAANIDNIIIVIAPVPQSHANLIDRYLVAAESINIRPTILLNKVDLIDTDPEQEINRSELDVMLSVYENIGYTVQRVSANARTGLRDLQDLLNDKTSIFVGQSGVGKSALINALLPDAHTLVGELSGAKGKGRHTTTSARLFHFPEGGDLIDSPGIREFGLSHISPGDLLEGFIEFRPFLGHCKFRDCQHQSEPECRLLQAVEEGDIDVLRMESYRQIVQSLDEYQ